MASQSGYTEPLGWCHPACAWVVVDRVEAPVLGSFDGPHVRSVTANLDMQGPLEELAADAPGRASAGGRFREAFVAMSTALSRGELDLAREQAPPHWRPRAKPGSIISKRPFPSRSRTGSGSPSR
jgi:hypothetical protein